MSWVTNWNRPFICLNTFQPFVNHAYCHVCWFHIVNPLQHAPGHLVWSETSAGVLVLNAVALKHHQHQTTQNAMENKMPEPITHHSYLFFSITSVFLIDSLFIVYFCIIVGWCKTDVGGTFFLMGLSLACPHDSYFRESSWRSIYQELTLLQSHIICDSFLSNWPRNKEMISIVTTFRSLWIFLHVGTHYDNSIENPSKRIGEFMFPRNDYQGGAVVTLFAMSDKPAAKCIVEWNGNFEAKYPDNYMKLNHGNLNRD